MEQQEQPQGFWSQLTPISKFLIFMLILGVLGASAYFIFVKEKTADIPTTEATATDSVSSAASDGSSSTSQPTTNTATDAPAETPTKTESVAADEKAAESAPVATPKPIEAKKVVKLPASKKPAAIVKKKENKAESIKPKKKIKTSEDVEVD